MRALARASAFALFLAGSWASPRAHARGQDVLAMFDEAMRLREQGKCDRAVPLFLAAQKIDETLIPTEYYLAECYEKLGETASAWSRYVRVAAKCQQRGYTEQERFARKRAAALEKRLSHLVLTVPAEVSALPGLEIRCDGDLLDSAAWSAPAPVNPGKHIIEVRATGRQDVTLIVDTDGPGTTREVEVPLPPPLPAEPLPAKEEPAPPPSAASSEAPPPPRSAAPAVSLSERPSPPRSQGSFRRTAALWLGGVGLASVAGGVATGAVAIARTDTLRERLQAQRTAAEKGEALAVANVSTGLFVAGGILVGGAAVLLLTSPSPSTTRGTGLVFAPMLGPGAAGGTARGAF
ncbi:hypothetical protein BE21_29800 [Sorangium cellulosum]|uniref:PEGA domain-containing protein n=1 Tax=Sorangium cellulosum TaxID=56 RepID=A0A150TRM6_SORCE|nr:hypothetical protein BE21_29800 [Sorangium cellulosum]